MTSVVVSDLSGTLVRCKRPNSFFAGMIGIVTEDDDVWIRVSWLDIKNSHAIYHKYNELGSSLEVLSA